jgi:hypothetical protein
MKRKEADVEKEPFVIAEVYPGKLNALVKNLMRQMLVEDPNEAVRRINSEEWKVSGPIRSWREEDGVIYFSVTSDGTTGPEWIDRLEKKGFRVGNYAKGLLLSPDFKPTSGVTKEIAVLRGMLFEDGDRITKKIRAEANRRNLGKSNAEVACLIREKFADKEIEAMGLWWIVVMHKSIKDPDGAPSLLSAGRNGGGRWLGAYFVEPDSGWSRASGFAFVVSQVGA